MQIHPTDIQTNTNRNKQAEKLDESIITAQKLGFDPYKKADINLAEQHRQARRIRKVEQGINNNRAKKCECCGFPIDTEPFSL